MPAAETIFFRLKYNVLILAAFLPILVCGMPATGRARPTDAVIYPADAKLTDRITAEVTTENGVSRAAFFLPIHAVKDTLTVEPAAGSGPAISSVSVEEALMPYAEEAKVLKEKLAALNQKKSETESRIKSAGIRIEFWQTRAKAQPDAPESAEALEKLDQAMGKGVSAAHNEIYAATQSLAEINDEIHAVQKEFDALTGAARRRWQVVVDFAGTAGAAAKTVDLVCTYHIRNCGWRSSYALNALPEKSETRLRWEAEITQTTGIDWDGVAVKIATARVITRPEPPFPRDWIISPRKPVDYSMARSKTLMKEESMLAMAPQADAEMVGGAPPEPAQEPGFTFDTYDLGRITVRSGESRRVTIRELALPSDFAYLIRPQMDPQAYLFAQINVPDADFIKLPEGDAAFLVNSAFVANRRFSMQDKDRKIFFGSDPQVDVKLATLDKAADETGFLMGKKHYRWGWKVTIANLKALDIAVEMEDAAPQIRDDRIKLKDNFGATAPEKEDNTLKWSFSVPALGKQTVEYGFTITYPDDMDLSFGGR